MSSHSLDIDLQSAIDVVSSMSHDCEIALSPRPIFDWLIAHVHDVTAQRHPLGFVHVELTPFVNLRSGERARLHLWDNALGTRDLLGDQHDHIWSLRSWVMRGALQDTTYDLIQTENGHYLGSRVDYGASNGFSPSGRYDLEPADIRLIRQGSGYLIPSGVVHESRVEIVPTSTLLVSRDDPELSEKGPLVLTPAQHRFIGTERRIRLSAKELLEVASSFA